MASGQSIQMEVPGTIAHHKIWRVQNENQSTHVLVNIAPQCDQAGFVENNRRDRPFLPTIPSQIESFRKRIKKNIVIRVIKIWKFNDGADLYRQDRWNEGQIFARSLSSAKMLVAKTRPQDKPLRQVAGSRERRLW
jgi:hypothetical protein